MAKEICVFCGEEVGYIRSEYVSCGPVSQWACKSCVKEVEKLSIFIDKIIIKKLHSAALFAGGRYHRTGTSDLSIQTVLCRNIMQYKVLFELQRAAAVHTGRPDFLCTVHFRKILPNAVSANGKPALKGTTAAFFNRQLLHFLDT